MGELENDHKTIVFIDELHLIVGAGAAEGAMDAGNILKPALARGKFQLIGATTTAGLYEIYRKRCCLGAAFSTDPGAGSYHQRNTGDLKGTA